MKIKPGANLDGLQAPMFIACSVVDEVYIHFTAREATFTSGKDGEHKPKSGRTSLHYDGLAGDWRTRDVGENLLTLIVNQIRVKLQAINPAYQVVREKNHLHIEFDKKG